MECTIQITVKPIYGEITAKPIYGETICIGSGDLKKMSFKQTYHVL
jgi:hypothetical protein